MCVSHVWGVFFRMLSAYSYIGLIKKTVWSNAPYRVVSVV